MKLLVLLCLALSVTGCASRERCDEWVTQEVVDYNFCRGNAQADATMGPQGHSASRCTAWGTREKLRCVNNPPVSGEPVNH